MIATGAHLIEATQRALPGLGAGCFLGEPVPRNTAPCIGWATLMVQRRDADAVVMVLPSDHHVGHEPEFHAAVRRAIRSAEAGAITTIGVNPTRPETGYGYIEVGDELGDGVHRVVRFVEKPNLPKAEEYLASGRYVWNSGMFCFRARVMLRAIEQLLPQLWSGLLRIESAWGTDPTSEARVTQEVFGTLEPISIDYGIMENLNTLHVVPASFGWSDLGSWQSVWELAPQDLQGNAADPNALLIDSRRNLVRDLRSQGGPRVLAVVGVEDLCVIETDDALLVIPRKRAQEVRLVVEALQSRGDFQPT